jgi:hypothetical protein
MTPLTRLSAATNCPSGEPSELKAIIDGITLILDLTINGRSPRQSLIVPCDQIPLNVNWKGFKVSYQGEGKEVTNSFEFEPFGTQETNSFINHVTIMRVIENNPIVAVDFLGEWPKCNDPVLPAGMSFRIDHIINGGPDKESVGWVDFGQNPDGTISLCPDYQHPTLPWKSNYIFTAFVSKNATNLFSCYERFENHLDINNKILVQSPFNETLNIYLPGSLIEFNYMQIKLLNMNGDVVINQHLTTNSGMVSIPIVPIPSGIYLLQIENSNELHTFKVVKSAF